MKCEEFEDRLNLALDQRQRPEWDADLQHHCQACAACRALAASYTVLLDGFYALATPEPPANLAIRVVDELRAQPSTRRRVSLATALLATAAAALLVLPILKTANDRAAAPAPSDSVALHSSRPVDGTARGWSEIDALPVVGPVLVSISDDDESTDPYAELAKGTGKGLASVVLYIPSIGSSPGTLSRDVVGGEPSWPEQLNEGLKPVTESVSETLDLLLRAWPLSEPSSRS